MPDRTLLLTGFGAFPGVVDNPTERIVAALDGTRAAGWRVHSVVLPVAWPRVRHEMADWVSAVNPAAIVHLGVAQDTEVLRVETQGANHLQFRVADVDGHQPVAGSIVTEAPEWLMTPVDARQLAGQLRDAGFEAHLSHDAGRYVCNATYFSSLLTFADRPVVFIHVPPVSEAWPLSRLTAAIGRAVACVVTA